MQFNSSVLACRRNGRGNPGRECNGRGRGLEGVVPGRGTTCHVEEHEESADTGAAMSMGKMDPHAPGWMKR